MVIIIRVFVTSQTESRGDLESAKQVARFTLTRRDANLLTTRMLSDPIREHVLVSQDKPR